MNIYNFNKLIVEELDMVDYLGSSDGPGAYGAENTDAAKPGTSADVYEYKIEMPNQQAASSLTK